MRIDQNPTQTPAYFQKQVKDTKKIRYHKSDAVKYLETLADEAARMRYPNTPPHYLCPRTYKDNTTNELTKCVYDFLKLNGIFTERTGNEGRVIDNRQAVTDVLGHTRMIGTIQRVYGSGTKGTSDLKAVINGRFIAIEIKCAATNDRQSNSQRTYQLEVEKSGGIYLLIPDFDNFLTWYQKFTK